MLKCRFALTFYGTYLCLGTCITLTVLQAIVKHLDNEDSYVYLNAIRALSAIGNAFTDRLLPLLLSRFLSTSYSLEFRLKVGEAIVRVLNKLGGLPSAPLSLLLTLYCFISSISCAAYSVAQSSTVGLNVPTSSHSSVW